MLYIWLSFSTHSLFIFRSSFDLTDLHLFPYNCFDSNSKRFVNCIWWRAKNRLSYKKTGKPGYQWLRVTTNNYERLPVKLRMTATAIGSNLRHKNVMNTQCFLDYTTENVVNTLKSVLKIVALHFWRKSLKNEILFRLWNLMTFFCGTL